LHVLLHLIELTHFNLITVNLRLIVRKHCSHLAEFFIRILFFNPLWVNLKQLLQSPQKMVIFFLAQTLF